MTPNLQSAKWSPAGSSSPAGAPEIQFSRAPAREGQCERLGPDTNQCGGVVSGPNHLRGHVMELIVDYPMPTTWENGLVVCVPTTITVEVEPDETIGCTDYYISAVHLEGHRMTAGKVEPGKPEDHRLPDADPMTEAIRAYVYRTHKAQLDGLWQQYLNDKPRPRRRA